jgi:hypothetical protein
MAVRLFNTVSIGAVCGIIFVFVTLWQLQSRDLFYTSLDQSNSTSIAKIVTNSSRVTDVEIAEPEPTRLSFLDIATKHGTDKVTIHHYNYSEFPSQNMCD